MKSKILVSLAIVVLAACSTPKYTYYFDHTNNHTSKKAAQPAAETSVLMVDPQTLTATTVEEPTIFPEVVESAPVKKTYIQMNKAERKSLRHRLKNEIKDLTVVKKKLGSIESSKASQGMDNDLKLAAIFGAVGIVGLLIATGSDVFAIIGGIALLIGVVFFVKWLIKQ